MIWSMKRPIMAVFGSSDQIQIFAFNLVHHTVHFSKGHNAGYDVGTNHVRRDDIRKSAVDHEVAGIREDSGMESGNIANTDNRNRCQLHGVQHRGQFPQKHSMMSVW